MHLTRAWRQQQLDLEPKAEELADAFAAMRSLHTLEIAFTSDPDQLLPHLARAPALRSLLLPVGALYDSLLPSVEALLALFAAAPNLRCTVHNAATISDPKLQRKHAALLQQTFGQLLDSADQHRFHIVSDTAT